jgi:uncharacterized phage-associated protein
MAHAKDISQYILEKTGKMTTIKLQKLVYYCQSWELVWSEKPLFQERIEAWASGPVVPCLFKLHKGQYIIGPEFKIGDSSALTSEEKDTIDIIIRDYGDKPTQWLVELTHSEDPWKDARAGLPFGSKSNMEITHAAMAEYYSGLLAE